MTTSKNLCSRARSLCRQEALRNGETELVKTMLEVIKEYEIAIDQNLRLESTIHRLTK
jgi:hypothetical protein